MADVLARILDGKRIEIAEGKAQRPQLVLESAIRELPPPRGFAAALDRAVAAHGYGLIAEIKKASPSAGLIRPDFDPPALARAYREGGAACLSVLTDGPSFQGSEAHLAAARAAVDLPVLRKDFMLDPWQVAESRAMGADCVLLIMAALADSQAADLEAAAEGFGMDVLIEVHNQDELARALRLSSPLIGINNRDLKTLKTDLATTEKLAELLPAGRVMVAESGLKTPSDLARMAEAGARRFLVGESLMREPDVAAATRALLARSQAA
jgi:indole-3-glycerol phosphate synthase